MEQRVWLVEKPRGDFQQVEMPLFGARGAPRFGCNLLNRLRKKSSLLKGTGRRVCVRAGKKAQAQHRAALWNALPSGAKALINPAIYGTAQAVPLVQSLSSTCKPWISSPSGTAETKPRMQSRCSRSFSGAKSTPGPCLGKLSVVPVGTTPIRSSRPRTNVLG
jgi:hypothetical protein